MSAAGVRSTAAGLRQCICNETRPAPYNESMTLKSRLQAWLAGSMTEADFEQWYRALLPRVYNFFRFRVGNDSIAEDLTSETIEKAWRSRAHYRSDLSAFSTWMFTVARRVAIDHYRRQRPSLRIPEDVPSGDDLEVAVQAADDIRHLSQLLAELPLREQEMFALKYGAELPNGHIARLFGLSESNTGVILHRALQALRDKWDKQA